MTQHIVYEVQNIVRQQVWVYAIKAPTYEEALEVAMSNDGAEIISEYTIGEPEFTEPRGFGKTLQEAQDDFAQQ